jgi:16S rRNA (uracil1498-N3)-methyltransferase
MRDHYTLARLFIPDALSAGILIDLAQTQAHFLHAVLRKRVGEPVRVFNGKDGEWLADISQLSKRNAQIKILEHIRPHTSAPDIWLLFAPVKKDRTRFIVEKATEMGVSCLRPVITDRTTGNVRMDKMQAHILEAAEQTERLDIPTAHEPIKLTDILASWDAARTLIFADEGGKGVAAATALAKISEPCAFLIGPQGGFSEEERNMLHALPYVSVIDLGPRILRADTAVVATLAIWQALSGDWS